MAADNVRELPAACTMTPEQALASWCRDFPGATDVIIIGYNAEGARVSRSSRMSRADALWILEQTKAEILRGD